MRDTQTAAAAVIGPLFALTIAGLASWWALVAVCVASAFLDAGLTRLRRSSICDRCGKGYAVSLKVYQGERMCQFCRDQTDQDDRLDDLVERATATVEELHYGDMDWPNAEETEEMEIRLRALGPHVEIAWRAYLRAATASNETHTPEARARRVEARDALLVAIQSTRQIRLGRR